MCEMSVLEGLWGKNTDKEGVAGGRVNAQAFSFTFVLMSFVSNRNSTKLSIITIEINCI